MGKSSTFATLEPTKPLDDAQMCGAFYLGGYMKICILVSRFVIRFS